MQLSLEIVSTMLIVLLLLAVLQNGLVLSKLEHGQVVVCYVGMWSVYRPGSGSFSISDIDPKLCSHIVYSFVGLDPTTNTIRSIDQHQDFEENYGKGSMRKMTQMKSKFPHLKVTLAVGGWNEGSKNYSDMAMSSRGREAFVKSAVDFVTKYNFDGFDLDWEFPTQRGGKAEDKHNFVLLVKELKQALSKKNLILSAALNPGPNTISQAYDIPEISKHLDFIHLMTYDYYGQWDKKVGPNAPLNGTDNFNVEASIKYLIKHGAPAEKIVVGIAAYGHTFTVEDGIEAEMKAPVKSSSFQGPYTRQEGFMGYNEICAELQRNSSWQDLWDLKSSTPYAVFGQNVISYDDERSIALKVEMGLQHGVAGFLVWSIDTDDFRGDCSSSGDMSSQVKNFPLLRAIHSSIENSHTRGPVPPMDLPNTIAGSSHANRLLFSWFVLACLLTQSLSYFPHLIVVL